MYKTIIMPVDVFEMELSDKAIRHAEFLAQQDGVIHLLHVLPGSASLSLHRFAADVRRFEEHLQHEAETRLQTMVGHFSIDPSRIKQHVRFGSVRDVVNELGEELNADVVVIGSRNPSITTHLLGSMPQVWYVMPRCRYWLCVNHLMTDKKRGASRHLFHFAGVVLLSFFMPSSYESGNQRRSGKLSPLRRSR